MFSTCANLTHFFETHAMGQYLWQQQQTFFQAHLLPSANTNTLLLGAFSPKLISSWSIQNNVLPKNLFPFDNIKSFPWADKAFDYILMAHETDFINDIPLFLIEIQRILQPHGQLIFTGFNPYSLWRWSKLGSIIRHSHSLSTLKQDIANTNWKIQSGKFINYLPFVQSAKTIQFCQFMELAGNRWWPHAASVYALVLNKSNHFV